ncbi:signal transduction histidine kinase [Rhodococcus sp. OK519]|uniref:sensor histidine kinase n=1 Tax=Rhodococcus sp. OK519 TaxID=2135729 RepID=UPI000D35005B|nr:signal transduction histidine kinase [Rhodococcus sp. OK519]
MDVVERWVQLSYRRPVLTASVVAVLVAVCAVIAVRFEQRGGRPGDTSTIAALIVASSAAGLTVKRTHPWWAFAITTAGTVGYIAYSGQFNAAATLPLSVCLCTLASRFEARTTMAATAAVCVALTCAGVVLGPQWLLVERIGLIGWPLLGACIGGVTRARNRYVTAVETRAQVSAALYDSEAERRVTEERLRISRDIHDVVAHHLTALNLQIGTARHVLDRPELAAQALAGMHENSEAALREIKGLVGMLRADNDEPRGPVPGLGDVAALVDAALASGLDVGTHVWGSVRPATPDVELAAYRVIQEALTNAAKHAPGQPVTLTMTYRLSTLTIELENRIAAARRREGGGGFGLAGMRERVRAAGGRLDADDIDGDLFVVSVELPLPSLHEVRSR